MLIYITVEAAAEAAGVFAFAEAAGMINYYVSPRRSDDGKEKGSDEEEESGYESESDDEEAYTSSSTISESGRRGRNGRASRSRSGSRISRSRSRSVEIRHEIDRIDEEEEDKAIEADRKPFVEPKVDTAEVDATHADLDTTILPEHVRISASLLIKLTFALRYAAIITTTACVLIRMQLSMGNGNTVGTLTNQRLTFWDRDLGFGTVLEC